MNSALKTTRGLHEPTNSVGPCNDLAALASQERKRILLADDDASVRESIARVLLMEGYDVICAATGHEALRRFKDVQPDLVLLDLKMPGKDGWDTFAAIENMQPFLPVILITALPNQHDRAVGAGIDALMEKPLNLPLLLAAIRKLLAESRRDRIMRLTSGQFMTVELTEKDFQ